MNHRQINNGDMLAMLRLTNRLHELPPNPIVRHEQMLAELCRIIGAAAGVSAVLDVRADHVPALLFLVYHGIDDQNRQSRVHQSVRAMDDASPSPDRLMRLLALPQSIPATLDASDQSWRSKFSGSNLDGPAKVYQARRQDRQPMQLGDSVGSILKLQLRGTDLISAISFHTGGYDRRAFSRRDRLVIRLFHSQIEWMFRAHLPAKSNSDVESLTPREQQTLRCLLAGDSEKQIAHKLARSQHTVHAYVKGIYRNFGVSSRGELLSLFVR